MLLSSQASQPKAALTVTADLYWSGNGMPGIGRCGDLLALDRDRPLVAGRIQQQCRSPAL